MTNTTEMQLVAQMQVLRKQVADNAALIQRLVARVERLAVTIEARDQQIDELLDLAARGGVECRDFDY